MKLTKSQAQHLTKLAVDGAFVHGHTTTIIPPEAKSTQRCAYYPRIVYSNEHRSGEGYNTGALDNLRRLGLVKETVVFVGSHIDSDGDKIIGSTVVMTATYSLAN